MNLVNQTFKHKQFGIGTVISQDAKKITIQFGETPKPFIYIEDTFKKFLIAEDPDVQAAILEEFESIRQAELQRKREAEEEKQRAEEARLAALAAKHTTKSNSQSKKAAPEIVRIPGKRMTFYVFQGGTYDQESTGGYLWAPIDSKTESTPPHHWTRLLNVQPGDIIFHGYKGHIQAISTARNNCYECIQPTELESEDSWGIYGRRVDCNYIPLKTPIKTTLYADDILRYCNFKYAPFDKDGNGNMGYLFDLDRDLAKIFLRGMVKYNPNLETIDYVVELLSEDHL